MIWEDFFLRDIALQKKTWFCSWLNELACIFSIFVIHFSWNFSVVIVDNNSYLWTLCDNIISSSPKREFRRHLHASLL